MKQRLRQFLSRRTVRHITNAGRLKAAVLVPIYLKEGQYYILFTKRTETVREHKGQISFPGGVYQPEDGTLLTTALRESGEEIGLKPDDLEVLGQLDDEISLTSNYVITPFVGLIPWPYPLRLNKEEAEEIMEVPVAALLDKGIRQLERHNDVMATAYHYRGKVIWGATARILDQFLDIFSLAISDKK